MFVDNIGHPAHIHARDINFVLVSLAPLANINTYKKRMGWRLPWFSSEGSDFNKDFGLSTPQGEQSNLNELLWTYPGAIGVKTGSTPGAGLCLDAAARRHGRTIIAVVLDARGDPFRQAARLLRFGFRHDR